MCCKPCPWGSWVVLSCQAGNIEFDGATVLGTPVNRSLVPPLLKRPILAAHTWMRPGISFQQKKKKKVYRILASIIHHNNTDRNSSGKQAVQPRWLATIDRADSYNSRISRTSYNPSSAWLIVCQCRFSWGRTTRLRSEWRQWKSMLGDAARFGSREFSGAGSRCWRSYWSAPLTRAFASCVAFRCQWLREREKFSALGTKDPDHYPHGSHSLITMATGTTPLTVLIAIDGSDIAGFALNCKYLLWLQPSERAQVMPHWSSKPDHHKLITR